MVIRKASHAGSWYPGSEKALLEAMKKYPEGTDKQISDYIYNNLKMGKKDYFLIHLLKIALSCSIENGFSR